MPKKKQNKPLWSGRFKKPMNDQVFNFSKSLHIDKLMAIEDIEGSLAHVTMLSKKNIIPKQEGQKIIQELKAIQQKVRQNQLAFESDQEDIHMMIESEISEKLPFGGKIHTARSRNDQVALDERLFLKKSIMVILNAIVGLQKSLLSQATLHKLTVMPGYTHLQRAQPILLAHHFLAYIEMFERDKHRFMECHKRLNYSPLGSAALGGTSFPIDRKHTAKALGFKGILHNSIDAVSDRDYVIEFVSSASITMMHLSRMSEEIVIWASQEFNFITLSDSFSTGSSIMPQKKNPDIAELVRGKVGSVYGNLINILTTMKGLPLAYNRDMQEDKKPIFETHKTLVESLDIFSWMISSSKFNAKAMEESSRSGYSTATEIADYLAEKGTSFRTAHSIAGQIVAYAIQHNKPLDKLSLEEYHLFSKSINKDIFKRLEPESTISRKLSEGSTSFKSVNTRITHWKKILEKPIKV